ncbi:hypothetical protein DV736_g1200, partial [Chaetothyriales sp. CBS 134916]
MRTSLILLAASSLLAPVIATSILKTNGFTDCGGDSTVKINKVDISFDRSNNTITFDVSGSSTKEQDVTANLIVTAYGIQVYNNSFDPCADSTKVDQLCPVPLGDFAANGSQQVPSEYASKIPSIAFSIPDLDGDAKMILTSKDGSEVACIQSGVTNGKTVELPAVSYVIAVIAAAALVASLASAAASGSNPGSSSSSPGFFETMWWFQGVAMNGMLSVNYPGVYRSFTKNFAFSTGLIPWASMQRSIDSFRAHTGGNTTIENYDYLRNATLVFPDNTTVHTTTSLGKRGLLVLARAVETSINATTSANSTQSAQGKQLNVDGIQGFVEQYSIPDTNTFMTVLLFFAVIVAVIVVSILLFKVILETWALFGSFPKSLTTFRKEYWRVMAQTIVNLILLVYGIWVLYCIFQFTNGDSWAAKLLAGLTLGLFTSILAFFTWRIFSVAHKLRRTEGTTASLYENKETWKKYKIFYENYKLGCWWLFVPAIIYMFAKGCILASANDHGLVQSVGQLIIESLMLALLLWLRPYNRKSGNWINIIIQIVRVLTVACILVFVEELGIAQTTKTITGVVLVVVQAALTGILAILIVVNSIITCCKENPHRKRRKAATHTALARDLESDAFLRDPDPYQSGPPRHTKQQSMSQSQSYEPMRTDMATSFISSSYRDDSQKRGLVSNAANFGRNGSGYMSVNQDFNIINSAFLERLATPSLNFSGKGNNCAQGSISSHLPSCENIGAGITTCQINARILLGSPGGPRAANTGYVPSQALVEIVKRVKRHYASSFGGVMIWDASQASANSGIEQAVVTSLRVNSRSPYRMTGKGRGEEERGRPTTWSGSADSTSSLTSVITSGISTVGSAITSATSSVASALASATSSLTSIPNSVSSATGSLASSSGSSNASTSQCGQSQLLSCCNNNSDSSTGSSLLPYLGLNCIAVNVAVVPVGDLCGNQQVACCSSTQDGLINVNAQCLPIAA